LKDIIDHNGCILAQKSKDLIAISRGFSSDFEGIYTLYSNP